MDTKAFQEAITMFTLNDYVKSVDNRNKNNVRVATYEVNPAFLQNSTAKPVDS